MRPWIRWTTILAGLLMTGIGGLAMWNVLAPGSERIVGAVDGWMFEGPALVTFGLLLLWTAGSTGTGRGALDRRGPQLLMQIGLGFIALPVATWAWNEASGTIASSYAWSFAAFALGVPGLALLLTGMALWLWRRMRSR
jgi:hypothetical protein